ncbi:MAG: imidazolonepropionase [Thermoplasmatota archaeon]
MNIDLLVINCSELHTMRGEHDLRRGEEMKDTGLVKNGAMAVDGENILEVGKTDELKSKYEPNKIIDASGKTVTPGFIDPHTHLVFAGSREDELIMKIKGKTYMEILEEGGGIMRTVKATRDASKPQLKKEMGKRMDTMLRYGTTTAEAKSGYGLDKDNEIKCLEVIKEMNKDHPIDLVPTYLGAHSLPPEFDDTGEYIEYCKEEVLPIVAERGLADYCDVFCEKGVFDAEESRSLLKKAKELDMGLRVHADEIENIGCSSMAAEVDSVSCEHIVKTSEDDIDKMVEHGVIGISLPGTPFMLMDDHYTPARKMIEKGMALALATDLNPNCFTESMQMIITLACLQMKMTPREALTASTVNAAKAIGRDDIGTLDKNKKADFLIMDIPNLMHLPYHFGVNLVEQVYKDGERVV